MVDVLDHVLDKGVVIDAWVRVAVAGIDLLTEEARLVVASIRTYLSEPARIAEPPVSAGPRIVSVRPRWTSIEEQLRRIRSELDMTPVFVGGERQRAEDRILEELRDARARVVRGTGLDARKRRKRKR